MDNSSITRISGMATGLDTDSIIKKLMIVEKIPLDKLKQTQQKDIWISDAYRQWNKDIFSFQSSSLFSMKLSSTYNTFNVTSTLANSVTGTSTSSSISGTYTVAVKSLAQSANLTSTNVKLDPTKPLNDSVQGINQLTGDAKININVYNDPKNPSTVQTSVIDIFQTDTINDVVSKINSATDYSGKSLGLQAFYDATLQQFIVKTKATGQATKIELGANTTDANFSNGVDFLSKTLGFQTITADTDIVTASGQNADIIFNGNEITTLASNNSTIMGISLSLKDTTYDESKVLKTSSIVVSQNIDTEVKNIKDFIDKYNDLLDKLNKVNNEPIYKDYPPLTDEQRSSLSETQIEQWEAKAKSGLLHGDSIVKSMINKMRSAMSSIIKNGSVYNSLSSVGISSKGYQDQGKLYVDDTKLRNAIQADPDGVRNLFSQIGDSSKGTNGVINILSEAMSLGVTDLTKKAGMAGSTYYDQSVIGKALTNIQKDIIKQNDRLSKAEEQYYKQFSAMESVVNQYNNQSSWLLQQFSSGQ